jgi:hypothetical protein
MVNGSKNRDNQAFVDGFSSGIVVHGYMQNTMCCILCAAILPILAGCVTIGDGVVNATKKPISLVTVWSVSGSRSMRLNAGMVFGFEKTETLEEVKAFDLDGETIGEFDCRDIPNARNVYGKHVLFAVFSDGLFPIPKKLSSKDYRFDEDKVKKVLQEERDYEGRLKH